MGLALTINQKHQLCKKEDLFPSPCELERQSFSRPSFSRRRSRGSISSDYKKLGFSFERRKTKMLRIAAKRLSSLSSSPWRANYAASSFVYKNAFASGYSSSDDNRSTANSHTFSFRPDLLIPFRGQGFLPMS